MTGPGTTSPAPACVVIGAGPGLGTAVARRFAAAGHPVGVVGRTADQLDSVVAELRGSGARAAAAAADAGRLTELRAALDQLRDELGEPGVLVYNAASYAGGTPLQLDPQQLTDHYAVNVVGALAAVQHLLPGLRAHAGTVLLTGGGAAVYPSPDDASLSLTKSGLRLLAQLLHQELTPLGVHVTTVTVEGVIGSRPGLAAETIAEHYLQLHRQPREQWTAELEHTG